MLKSISSDKRGLTFFYTFMLGMIIVVLGIASFTPIKNVMDANSTNLTCSSPASDYDQALCWLFDILKFVIPSVIVLIGVAIISARRYIIG